VSPLPEADEIVGPCSSCVALPNLSRHGLLLRTGRADSEPKPSESLTPSTQRHAPLNCHRTRCTNGSLQSLRDFRSATFFYAHRFQSTQVFFSPRATDLFFLGHLSSCVGAAFYHAKINSQFPFDFRCRLNGYAAKFINLACEIYCVRLQHVHRMTAMTVVF
jgi:hypothetical protein